MTPEEEQQMTSGLLYVLTRMCTCNAHSFSSLNSQACPVFLFQGHTPFLFCHLLIHHSSIPRVLWDCHEHWRHIVFSQGYACLAFILSCEIMCVCGRGDVQTESGCPARVEEGREVPVH